MNSDYNSSHHGTGAGGRVQILSSDGKDFKEWFQEYTAIEGDDLFISSNVIQAVNSDKLDADFVEQRLRQSAPKAPITNRFCASCQDLFDNWPTLGTSSTRGHDSEPDPEVRWESTTARPCNTFELEGSARFGCRFCAFLLQTLKDGQLLDTFRKIEVRLYHLDENAMSFLSIENWVSNKQLLWLNLPGKVCTHCNTGIAAELSADSCFLPASANCYDDPLDVFDITRTWLSICSESHALCNSKDNGMLPARLISISRKSPRLVLTSECPVRPSYATLSHSWGSCDVIKLTSENLDSLMRIIPVEGLPKTFKDAIEIAQNLGLDYLWIDSLCIIQDSEDDWQKESALMNSVYGGSTINIAASSARDSNDGCFLKPSIFSGGLRALITDGGRRRVQDFRTQDVYALSTYRTHLGTRACALQEKLLPPRTIHFGDRGAFWECREMIASEDLPAGFPDKLPALSGIARLVYNETSDQYLAGLWRSRILEQLCWSRCGPKSRVERPVWRAPTWSWASVDGSVHWRPLQDGILETKYAHVLDVTTVKCGPDPFGQVTKGIIRLACSIMVAGYFVHSNKSSERVAEEDAIIVSHASDKEQEFPVQIDYLDHGYQDNNEQIYLLPLLSGRTGSLAGCDGENMIDELLIEGIVLRATYLTKGEFSRIGSFNFYKNKWSFPKIEYEDDEAYDIFLQLIEEDGTSTAKAACAEIISNPEYPDK